MDDDWPPKVEALKPANSIQINWIKFLENFIEVF